MKKPISEIIREVKEFAGYDIAFLEDQTSLKSKDKLFKYLESNELKLSNGLSLKADKMANNFKYHLANDGWILLRFSGTEPVCRIFVEVKDPIEANKIKEEVKKIVSEFL